MFKKIAVKLRHIKILEKQEWIWNMLRKPYHLLINLGNKGVKLELNNGLVVRLPPEYYNLNIVNYEVKSVDKLITWIKKNPKGYLFDIGCSVGYISSFALFSSKEIEVFAFDSDLPSLKATKNICKYSTGDRLNVVYGFVSEKSSSLIDINGAIQTSESMLNISSSTGLPGTTQYVNLDRKDVNNIPIYTIDQLFNNYYFQSSNFLIKCDVEGAELFVINGAKGFIKKYTPQILLSVHPDIISTYDHTVDQIKAQLIEHGYEIEVIDIDHEEHWWCTNKLNCAT